MMNQDEKRVTSVQDADLNSGIAELSIKATEIAYALGEAKSMDERFEVQDRYQKQGELLVVKDGTLLAFDDCIAEFTTPSHFERIKKSFDGIPVSEESASSYLIESFVNRDDASMMAIYKLPNSIKVADLVFGQELQNCVSENALRKFCDSLEDLTKIGVYDTRAFDPSNWAYSSRDDQLVLLSGLSRKCGDPAEFLRELEGFRNHYGIVKDPMKGRGSDEQVQLASESMPSPVVDIISTNPETAILSNFGATPFVLGGKQFASVEGFIHFIKIPPNDKDLKDVRYDLPRCSGKDAYKMASRINASLRPKLEAMYDQMEKGEKPSRDNTVFVSFKDERHTYGSEGHHDLIERAIRAKFIANESARDALLGTGRGTLRHSAGDAQYTSLPAQVFCDILERIRTELQETGSIRPENQRFSGRKSEGR